MRTQAQIAKFTVDIDPTNDIPVVTASSSSAAFVEIDGPSDTSVAAASQGVAIDAGITVTNRDDTQEGDIASAVVEITNNASTGDELLFVNTAKVILDTAQNNTATKLHLKAVDGSTTTADFEAALRLVEFNNTSETPSESPRTVTFTVTDAATTGGESPQTHTATRDVTVQAVKDSPVIDMDNPSGTDQPYTGNNNTIDTTDKTVTFNEVQGADTAANAQAFGAVISDLDSDLKSVTVSVNAADVKSGDQLLLAGVALDMSQAASAQTVSVGSKAFSVSIAVDGDPAVSTLTMQSLGSNNQAEAKPVADFNALLATLSFNNTSDNPDPAAREYRLGATDATDAAQAQIAKFTVDIDPTNDIPVVTTSSSSAAFVEIDGPSDTSVAAASQGVAIDPGITVTNRDDTQEGDIASAVVEITTNASTGDELLFVNTAKVILDTAQNNTATKLHLKAVDGSPQQLTLRQRYV